VGDCETVSRNIEALIDSCMYLIGILVSFFLFRTVNIIYKFATKGRLPREIQRKRMTNCIVITIVQTLLFFAIFVVLNEMIKFDEEFMHIGRLLQFFSIYRIIGFVLNMLLICMTISRLHKAKVRSTDTGHLNMCHAKTLLVLLILQALSASVIAIAPIFEMHASQDIVRDILNFMLAIMYFKMIAHFITDYRLTTKVSNEDGIVDIVGLNS